MAQWYCDITLCSLFSFSLEFDCSFIQSFLPLGPPLHLAGGIDHNEFRNIAACTKFDILCLQLMDIFLMEGVIFLGCAIDTWSKSNWWIRISPKCVVMLNKVVVFCSKSIAIFSSACCWMMNWNENGNDSHLSFCNLNFWNEWWWWWWWWRFEIEPWDDTRFNWLVRTFKMN